jgi:hypothetical protein
LPTWCLRSQVHGIRDQFNLLVYVVAINSIDSVL